MDKQKPGQPASPKHSGVNNTSKHAQLARLVARLQEGPISTIEARRDLNIMAPAARIRELREEGVLVLTHLRDLYDDQGRYHSRVAVYYLSDRGEVAA